MIYVSVTDVLLIFLVVQAANMTMQPCQHLWLQTQLTLQEMIIMQTMVAFSTQN